MPMHEYGPEKWDRLATPGANIKYTGIIAAPDARHPQAQPTTIPSVLAAFAFPSARSAAIRR